jgi:hypothetical protein
MDDWAENYSSYLEEDESERTLAIHNTNDVIEGEDSLAVLATANKFIDSMECAFRRRFPEPTQFAVNVTFNALLYSLVGFCRSLGKGNAMPAIDHVMNAMMELEDELEETIDTDCTDPEIS